MAVRLAGAVRGRLLTRIVGTGARLNRNLLSAGFAVRENKIASFWARISERADRIVGDRHLKLLAAARVLRTVSYQNVLDRGFALVRDNNGVLLRRAADVAAG